MKKKTQRRNKPMIQPPKATISLDLKKNRIRIHKQTLHALNDPDYVLFLVNPEKKVIGVKVCDKDTRLANKITYDTSADCDFYSKELLHQLGKVCTYLTQGTTFRISGTIHADKGIALFNMDDSTPVTEQSQDDIQNKG